MHLTSRVFHVGVALFALGLPTLYGQTGCSISTPEPATFWLIGAGAGAILVLRRMRGKKK